MGTIDSKYGCTQKECKVQSTGLCLEGLPISECQHSFVADDEIAEDSSQEEEVVVNDTTDNYNLFSGDELDNNDITSITHQFPAKLIVVMGEPNCGKTTILISLYEKFQKSEFNGFFFSGSKTQRGFERRCHPSRLGSGYSEAQTARTTQTTFHYLHLALREKSFNSPIQHLLFSDISGELFRRARDSDDEINQLSILRRADVIFCAVDGELLADKIQRHSTRQALFNLIGRAEQNDMFPGTVNIVVTKWDKVIESNSENMLDEYFVAAVKQRFPNIIANVIKMAARSTTKMTKSGLGLGELLSIACNQFANASKYEHDNQSNITEREFHKYKYQRP